MPEPAQLTLTSCAHPRTSPIEIASLEVTFESGLKPLEIFNDTGASASIESSQELLYYELNSLASASISASVIGTLKSPSSLNANLTFHPGTKKIFSFKVLPREAGEIQAQNMVMKIRQDAFNFDMCIPLRTIHAIPPPWYAPRDNSSLARHTLDLEQSGSLTVLPKPPKLRISPTKSTKTFYVDEMVEIAVQLLNEEDSTADVKLNIALLGPEKESLPALYLNQPPRNSEPVSSIDQESQLNEQVVGEIPAGRTAERSVFFRALRGGSNLTLVIAADYNLVSDPETPIHVQWKEHIHIVTPFELSYEFLPQLRSDPWPSYFVIDSSATDKIHGITQSWRTSAKATSLATQTLMIETMHLKSTELKSAARCSVVEADTSSTKPTALEPNQCIQRCFAIDAQKADLDDRRTAAIGLELEITWHRHDESSKRTTSKLPVPALAVPFGEPRVLCIAQRVPGSMPVLVNVTYVLENPSAHFLTFSVTMETSDEFAFSGPKAKVVQLVPISRASVQYTLIPLRQGVWIHPYLRVTDTGFGQELKVHAAEGCRSEKKAVAIWVEARENEAEA